jgi:small-conductance mechanosensitive channel
VKFGRTLSLFLVFALPASAAPPNTVPAHDVIEHLEQAISWYRDLNSLDPSAGDQLIRDNLHQTSVKALQLSFQFARAESALVSSQQNPKNPAPSGSLQQSATTAAERVSSVEGKISQIDADLLKAKPQQRDVLTAQRNELNAELDLAKEIQAAIQNLVNFTGSMGAGGGALARQIDELERSVPEAIVKTSGAKPPASVPPVPIASPAPFSTDSAGVFGLASELFGIFAARSRLQSRAQTTAALTASIEQLKVPLLNEARTSIQQSDQILSQAASEDPAQLHAAQNQIVSLANQFKQLSTAIIPLNEEGIAVNTAASYLAELIRALNQQSAHVGRALLLRAGGLALLILVVLFIGDIWRRATFRYVRDTRRRRQFLVVRRVVVVSAIVLTVLFGFVSEFGSLATYAGFVTAGVAVALQSPILAVVAYFFLIGRYGIRVGDRVTISGVTGEVMEIGFVRIYLLELAGTGPDLHSTGRVVVFSNSVIFQPAAMYKQMPGIDYVWHTVALTLAADSDFQLAEKTLNAAVDSVYGKYSERIERQFASAEESANIQMSAPKPESRLRYTDAGLLYTVRYPAESQEAIEMDNQILRAMYDAISSEPKLTFAPSGTPKLQTS